jgi:hypothetical protein
MRLVREDVVGSALASLGTGVLATVGMDAAMVVASRIAPAAFATDEIGLELIGRWAGGLLRGHLRHDAIVTEEPIGGEVAIGVTVHYLTGTILTVGYLEAMRRTGRKPRLASATAYGLATGALPLLVMYPAMGLGCCGARSSDMRRLISLMMLGHLAFGVGIGWWSEVLQRRSAQQITTRRG